MLYWFIILIEIIEYLLDLMLDLLNVKASKRPIPNILHDLYDGKAYKRQQLYFRANKKIGFISSLIDTIVGISLFAFGAYGWMDGVVREIADSEIIRTLLFMGIFSLIGGLVSLPFDIYHTFVIEQRFGFNKITPRLFVMDLLKGLMLSVLIGGGLLALFSWTYGMTREWFWLLAWGVMAIVTLVIQYFYSTVLVPLFNKQTPLPEGALRNAIEQFAQSVKFELKNIYVIDGSKRSSHSNAYFTGWGRQKRVVLYDTLMDELTNEEIVGVLAHEIGHYKHHHIIYSLVTSLVTMLVMFYLLGLLIDSNAVAEAAGSSEPSFYVNLTIFSMIYTPLTMVLNVKRNVVSRRNERQADRFALLHGMGRHEASALKKMSSKSLSNLTPHWLVVFMTYSHPTLAERVRMLESVSEPEIS